LGSGLLLIQMQSCPKVQDIQISERSPVENKAKGNPIKTHKARAR
jgi:hypothetical protein